MGRNTRYLLGLWAIVGLILALVISSLISEALRGRGGAVAASVLAACSLVVVIRWWVHRQVPRLLKSPSADALVAFYRRTMRTRLMPDGDAILAHCCALAQTLYGEYAAARRTLHEIDWHNRVPLIQASAQHVEALLCYFTGGQYERGLELARSARQMASVSEAFPGVAKSKTAFDSLVEIGEVLCGPPAAATVESLERNLRMMTPLERLVVAWGLAVAYRKTGEDAKAEAMEAYLHATAPHCRALSPPPFISE